MHVFNRVWRDMFCAQPCCQCIVDISGPGCVCSGASSSGSGTGNMGNSLEPKSAQKSNDANMSAQGS